MQTFLYLKYDFYSTISKSKYDKLTVMFNLEYINNILCSRSCTQLRVKSTGVSLGKKGAIKKSK